MTNDSFLFYFDLALRKGIVTRPVIWVVNTVWVSGGREISRPQLQKSSKQGNGITESWFRLNASKDLQALQTP